MAETNHNRKIAYFSMEIALEASMPTYCGGLGVLAGDTVRSAADMRVPMVAVTLLHRNGYFHQRLDAAGWQTEEPVVWAIDDFLRELPERVTIPIEGRAVSVRAWTYEVAGIGGATVPVLFLDTDLPENSEWDRAVTNQLYQGDPHYRLCQEIVLGMGGVRLLRALGYQRLQRFHMNEGHSALLTLELLAEVARARGGSEITVDDMPAVREQCVFTTHTPVAAGHDQFPMDLVSEVLECRDLFQRLGGVFGHDVLNMTHLALVLSRYVNGVAKRHGEISRGMFTGYAIDAITNGVHAATWVSEAMAALFDQYIPAWRQDNATLRYALAIPRGRIWEAHQEAKWSLLETVNRETNAGMDVDVLTLGFARRATPYKRTDLLFHDLDRLQRLTSEVGQLQVVFAGKAHPGDNEGKLMIQRVFEARDQLKGRVRIAYLPNYDMTLGGLITSGVDVWLNNPQPPLEASGTSGMKAALNGVPSLSVLDGWWIEGCIEGVTGWAIGDRTPYAPHNREADACALYDRLEHDVLPLFYRERDRFVDIMLHAIALNGSFFNTQRMLQQYVLNAYFL